MRSWTSSRAVGIAACVVVAGVGCGSSSASNDEGGASGADGGNDGTQSARDAGGDALAPFGDAGAARDATPSNGDAAPGPAGDGGCVPSAPPVLPEVNGCASARFYALPADPSAHGPWPVGARTTTVAGLLTEVWYPAKLGSDQCRKPLVYDVREHLPPSERTKIPNSDAPTQTCDCYRDLPLDDAHGPYPVISFVHGTAAFRTQSLTFATHWASRGFVVVASDHPHIQLADILTFNVVGTDQAGDAIKVLTALDAPSGDLGFLLGHLDMQRIGAAGHSAGGQAVANLASRHSGIRVVIPMAAGGTTKAGDLSSSLVMSAANDGIAQPSGQVSGYGSTQPRKRFVQIDRAGHLVFSDLCSIGAAQGGLLAIAVKYGVNGANLLASLANDGCPWQTNASYTAITPLEGWTIVDAVTSAAWEETLLCNTAMASTLASIRTTFPLVKDYQEQLQ